MRSLCTSFAGVGSESSGEKDLQRGLEHGRPPAPFPTPFLRQTSSILEQRARLKSKPKLVKPKLVWQRWTWLAIGWFLKLWMIDAAASKARPRLTDGYKSVTANRGRPPIAVGPASRSQHQRNDPIARFLATSITAMNDAARPMGRSEDGHHQVKIFIGIRAAGAWSFVPVAVVQTHDAHGTCAP